MLPSASVLAYRREERVQKAFSGDHHGHGDARLRASAHPLRGVICDYVQEHTCGVGPSMSDGAADGCRERLVDV